MDTEDPERGTNINNTVVFFHFETWDRQWTSWLIPVFVVANIAVFIVTMYVNNCPKNYLTWFNNPCIAKFLGRLSFEPFRYNPMLGPSSPTLEKMGGLVWDKVVNQRQGWRLFTCMWLHAGVIHLLANMLCLIFIGIFLEWQFGFVRVGTIYLLSGFGGSILPSLFIQRGTSVGGSSAVCGLLGAMLSKLLTNWTIYSQKFASLLVLMIFNAIDLAVGALPFVENFGHIGGFLTGFLLGFVLLVRPQFGRYQSRNLPANTRVNSRHKAYRYVLLLAALVLLLVGFTLGLVMLFRGVNGNDHCSWCRTINCLPPYRWKCND